MREGVEYVRNRYDSARDRDVLAGQAIRIPAAFPALVMGKGDLFRELEKSRSPVGEDIGADGSMRFHNPELCRCQLPGLEQERIRDGRFAHVVKRRCQTHQLYKF